MTTAYDFTLSHWKDIFTVPARNVSNDTDYVSRIPVFYLNPPHLIKRRKHMEQQFNELKIPEDVVTRVETTPFPKLGSHKLKNDIVTLDHIRMWKLAIKKKCKNGAFFFEDDVFFLKNWRQQINNIFDTLSSKLHILRMDAAPLIRILDLPHDKLAVFLTRTFACMGGYYLSQDAIVTALTHVNTTPWRWNTCESLLKEITQTYFDDYSYETSPRLCIQNWFIEDTSNLQSHSHVAQRKKAMYSGYMQQYHNRYMLDNLQRKIVKKNMK